MTLPSLTAQTSPQPIDAPFGPELRPEGGAFPLPMLTLDSTAYRSNRDSLLRYGQAHGALFAPHVKTAMIPELAADFVAKGGWGVTVADTRQAAVMIEAGIARILIANEVGGVYGARHLARLALAHPETELSVFVDSVEAVTALETAWCDIMPARPLPVLIEVGVGRAGVRDRSAFAAVLDAVLEAEGHGHLRASGVAAYEGAAAVADAAATIARVDALLDLAADGLRLVRDGVGDDRVLIATAGGSIYFDRVVAILKPAVAADGRAALVLRPGAILYGDHGLYERGLAAMDARGGFGLDGQGVREAFRPVLRVFAEVLSRPETALAICGMGMRHVSYDAGLPRPLRIFRDGVDQHADTSAITVQRLNDQHAFLAVADAELRVGDVIEFGISHPCTCLHLWRTVRTLDADGHVTGTLTTRFD